ncbi:MAG TPA: hypothetical protein DHV89_03410 [Ruminococcus sp.]|nr:hypothetical protein [Ruminococcus sp.]
MVRSLNVGSQFGCVSSAIHIKIGRFEINKQIITFRIICLMIVFQLAVPIVSPVISFADEVYKIGAERAKTIKISAKYHNEQKSAVQSRPLWNNSQRIFLKNPLTKLRK